MSLGTYSYGVHMRWGGQVSSSPVFRTCDETCHPLKDSSILDPVHLPDHDLTLLRLRQGECGGQGCVGYCISLHEDGSGGGHKPVRKVIIRRDVAERLYWRFISTLNLPKRHTDNYLAIHTKCASMKGTATGTSYPMPGCKHFDFLTELCEVVSRKYENRMHPHARTVTPDLYSLWVLTCGITAELFADALNESGVMQNYCSSDKHDSVFGSIGAWEDVEGTVEGAGGNPPFEKMFIDNVISQFDKGARGFTPYCRCVLLPLGKSYGVVEKTTSLTSKGILLVRIPPGCLPFRRQECYFSYNSRAVHNEFLELGVFIWRNREYLEKYPPPKDVETLYFHWILRACSNPAKVTMDMQAFAVAFPMLLRTETRLLGAFN